MKKIQGERAWEEESAQPLLNAEETSCQQYFDRADDEATWPIHTDQQSTFYLVFAIINLKRYGICRKRKKSLLLATALIRF